MLSLAQRSVRCSKHSLLYALSRKQVDQADRYIGVLWGVCLNYVIHYGVESNKSWIYASFTGTKFSFTLLGLY